MSPPPCSVGRGCGGFGAAEWERGVGWGGGGEETPLLGTARSPLPGRTGRGVPDGGCPSPPPACPASPGGHGPGGGVGGRRDAVGHRGEGGACRGRRGAWEEAEPSSTMGRGCAVGGRGGVRGCACTQAQVRECARRAVSVPGVGTRGNGAIVQRCHPGVAAAPGMSRAQAAGQDTGTPGHRDTRTWGHRDMGTPVLGDTRMWGHQGDTTPMPLPTTDPGTVRDPHRPPSAAVALLGGGGGLHPARCPQPRAPLASRSPAGGLGPGGL